MGPVLIMKTGSTLPSVAARRKDYEHWITSAMGLASSQVRIVSVHKDEPLPDPQPLGAIVVTGSSAMVTEREPWSERSAGWLHAAVRSKVPTLGICYGHQLLAHAFGGTVEYNPRGRQIGTIDVQLDPAAEQDALFSGFPPLLHLPVSHRQSVTRLPAGAARLASSARDPNHAFRLGDWAWGVQFHPEFDADIVRGYIDARRTQLSEEGLDPEALAQQATDSAHGSLLLRRFAHLARLRA